MFDKDITIINRYIDTNRKPQYKATCVKGFWSSNNGISINGTDLVKADGLTARILMSQEGYQSPKEFEKNQTGWTLKKDDYLVKGQVEFTTLNDILDNYETMKITNIAEKDYGSEDMRHWAITGA